MTTTDTLATKQNDTPQRLPYMPITLFAQIMGLGGLAISWDRLGDIVPGGQIVGLIIAIVASLYFAVLLFSYAAKVVKHPDHTLEELNHPIRLNFFPTVSISLLLLSIYWQQFAGVSLALWVLGASLHLIATLYVMSSWLHQGHYQVNHINPGWFIPVVGNIIVPINGAYFGFIEISWFFFSIGIIYWLVLLTIVMNRLFVYEALPPKLTPMMFILLAPPSIGFVSYTLLTGELDIFARILYYAGLFIALLLTVNLSRFWKLPFFISSWAYSFPLAALTIASTRFAHLSGQPAFKTIAVGLLVVLTVVIAWLVYRTILAARAGKICVPEQ